MKLHVGRMKALIYFCAEIFLLKSFSEILECGLLNMDGAALHIDFKEQES